MRDYYEGMSKLSNCRVRLAANFLAPDTTGAILLSAVNTSCTLSFIYVYIRPRVCIRQLRSSKSPPLILG